MTHGSLFSGIGGFDYAAEQMGWENLFHCEWNEFGQRVLKHYFPQAQSYHDITKSDFTIWRGKIDIITGGFPCQPYSQAGKRLGKEDDRHLWPEMLRVIREVQPRWVVGENVSGLINWNDGMVFDEVQADLEAQGYEVQPYVLPACAVNAPHRRDRVWFVAYRDSNGLNQRNRNDEIDTSQRGFNALGDISSSDSDGTTTNTNIKGLERATSKRVQKGEGGGVRIQDAISTWMGNRKCWQNFPTQPPICGGDDGLPTKLDRITFPKWRNESIKAYGNAIVPQVALQIFRAIEQYEQYTTQENNP